MPYRLRWVMECTFRWLGHFCCLVGRSERLVEVYWAFFVLAFDLQ